MKILLLTDRMEAGGAETHVVQLAIDLVRAGHEVLLWSSGGSLASKLKKFGIRQAVVSAPTRNPFSLLRKRIRLRHLVKKEHIQVLHAHTRLTAQLIRGFRRHGCAEIVTAHARFKSDFFLARVCYWGEITVAVGEDIRAYLTKTYQLPIERTRVIPNGVDRRHFFPCDNRARSLSVLFASRLDADCSLGAELLCQIAQKLYHRFPAVKISIAGGGSELARISRLANKVNRVIGKPVIRLLGWVEDMAPVLREHTVFVGVSRAAIEAAACGCAVILCGNEGYLGIWDNDRSEYAALSNFCARGESLPTERALLSDLCILLQDESERNRVASEAYAYVESHLDSQAVTRKTLEVYREALPHAKLARVAIGGYFGCGNLGDDAILQGTLYELRKKNPGLAITVLSGAPATDRCRLRINAIPRKNPIAISWTLCRSDLFLLGGGSLLQNRTGNLSLLYYLGLLRLSRLWGCPAALYACGIGPLLGDRAKRHAVKALRATHGINLRDRESLLLLRKLRLPEPLLSQGADAALLLPPPDRLRSLFLRRSLSIPSDQPLMGVILRPPGEALQPKFSLLLSFLHTFCQEHGMRPLFLVFDRNLDATVTQKVFSSHLDLQAKCAIPKTPSDALSLLSLCRVTLSMRLHGVILSAHVGIPCVAISTDETDSKIPAFAESIDQPTLSLHTLDSDSLETAFSKAMETPRAELRDRCRDLRKKAQKDLANALRIVYNNR